MIARIISRTVLEWWRMGLNAKDIAKMTGLPTELVVVVIFGPIGFAPTFPYMGAH